MLIPVWMWFCKQGEDPGCYSSQDCKQINTDRVITGHQNKIEMLSVHWKEIGVMLEHSPWIYLRCLAQETDVSKLSAWTATKLLKLKPFKTTVVHELQPRDSINRINFCEWILPSVHVGETDPYLIFLYNEAKFHLDGEVNSQKNRYWNSHNWRLIHEVPLHIQKLVYGVVSFGHRK